MQCDLRGANETRPKQPTTETMPRPGRVTEVCREWLVHEDGALAYRLQNEEIEHHYTGNKFRNALVRQDIPWAKDQQKREEEEAANAQAIYDNMIQEQEEHDAMVAKQLADRIEREEYERRLANEQRDKEIAFQYQERERQRYEVKRLNPNNPPEDHLAVSRLEQSHAEFQAVPARVQHEVQSSAARVQQRVHLDEGAHASNYEQLLVHDMRKSSLSSGEASYSNRATTSDCRRRSPGNAADPFSDLSDFCLQPDPNMSEEEARFFQEEQDAELARLLQEQEMKRRGDSMLDRDRVMAVEAQDHELARLLHDKEKAKVKRARERARQRSLMKKQQRDGEGGEVDETNPQPSSGEFSAQPPELERKPLPKVKGKPRCPDPPGTISNIAMAIDPTYNLQPCSEPRPDTPPVASPVSSPSNSLSPQDLEEEDPNAIPPYMPIQGQRRSASLEKKSKKTKVKKEPKDGCKQQ